MASVELSFPFALEPAWLPHTFARRLLATLRPHDLAMDLGTANTLIYMRSHGVVVNEPSMLAVEEKTRKIVAIGHAAKRMFGKTSPAIRCIRPMKDGVIADFEMTAAMIQYMLQQVRLRFSLKGLSLGRPRMVIGVPPEITQVEKRAVIEATLACGVREVLLVEEPMAVAVGLDLPINQAIGNMIVDIGGGTTDVAIISMGGTFYSHSIRVAGDEMDEAIQYYMRKNFSLQIGILEAERIKLLIGSALASHQPRSLSVCGRDMASGCPRQVEISDFMVREALDEPICAIIASVKAALEQPSPELVHDISARGVQLAGGGALLKGLNERLHLETSIRFHRAPDPLTCVVRGVGKIVEDIKVNRGLCIA